MSNFKKSLQSYKNQQKHNAIRENATVAVISIIVIVMFLFFGIAALSYVQSYYSTISLHFAVGMISSICFPLSAVTIYLIYKYVRNNHPRSFPLERDTSVSNRSNINQIYSIIVVFGIYFIFKSWIVFSVVGGGDIPHSDKNAIAKSITGSSIYCLCIFAITYIILSLSSFYRTVSKPSGTEYNEEKPYWKMGISNILFKIYNGELFGDKNIAKTLA